MAHSSSLPFLRETLLFLALVGVLIPLLQRLRINQVIGFLVVGVLVGPFGFVLWSDTLPWLEMFSFPQRQEVHSLAEMGVIFLMFLIGLELSVQRMWALRKWVFVGGLAQVLISALVIGGLAQLFGNSLEVSLILGLVLSLSSTAVVMQLLTEKRSLAQPLGQAVFAVLMLQDFAVVPLLILIDLLGREAGDVMLLKLAFTALKSVAVVAAIFVLGRKLIRPVFRIFAKQHQPEVFMALTLLVALSTAWVTAAVGLSLALGAFIAGLLMAETEYRHEVEVTIEPFKGLLMGLFFMSVGMEIDLRVVAQHQYWVWVSVVGLIVLKALIAGTVFRLGGLSRGRALEGGLLLAQGGEFAFIVLGAAALLGLLSAELSQFMLLVVSFSLMVTPLVAHFGAALGRRWDRRADSLHDPVEALDTQLVGGHVVIAGQGRVGRLLSDVLTKQGVSYVAVEHDAELVARLVRQGRPVIFGNAARPDLLRKLHTAGAAALVITMDQPSAAMHTVKAARAAYPDLPIFARSRDEQHAHELRAVGATAVVPETLESGLQLSAFALQALGVPDSVVVGALEAEREQRVANG